MGVSGSATSAVRDSHDTPTAGPSLSKTPSGAAPAFRRLGSEAEGLADLFQDSDLAMNSRRSSDMRERPAPYASVGMRVYMLRLLDSTGPVIFACLRHIVLGSTHGTERRVRARPDGRTTGEIIIPA